MDPAVKAATAFCLKALAIGVGFAVVFSIALAVDSLVLAVVTGASYSLVVLSLLFEDVKNFTREQIEGRSRAR